MVADKHLDDSKLSAPKKGRKQKQTVTVMPPDRIFILAFFIPVGLKSKKRMMILSIGLFCGTVV
jgi:hypothetical protein